MLRFGVFGAVLLVVACGDDSPEKVVTNLDTHSVWQADGVLVISGQLDIQHGEDTSPELVTLRLSGVDSAGRTVDFAVDPLEDIRILENGVGRVLIEFTGAGVPSTRSELGCPTTLEVHAAYDVEFSGKVERGETSFSTPIECDVCPEPTGASPTALDSLGYERSWQQVLQGSDYIDVTQLAAAADGAVWVLGPAPEVYQLTRVDVDGAAGFMVSGADPRVAVGSAPGAIVGALGTDTLVVTRHEPDGEIVWSHTLRDVFGYEAVVAAANEQVVVAVNAQNDVRLDDEVVAPAGNYLFAFDEMTGGLVVTVPSFAVSALVANGDGSFTAGGIDARGATLAVLEPDLSERWSVDPGVSMMRPVLASSSTTGDVFVVDPGGSVSSFGTEGQSQWFTNVESATFQIRGIAPARDGSVILADAAKAYVFDDRGEIVQSTTPALRAGLPWCPVGEAFVVHSQGDVPAYAIVRAPTLSTAESITVGRFR